MMTVSRKNKSFLEHVYADYIVTEELRNYWLATLITKVKNIDDNILAITYSKALPVRVITGIRATILSVWYSIYDIIDGFSQIFSI
jgi:hypothetical protein